MWKKDSRIIFLYWFGPTSSMYHTLSWKSKTWRQIRIWLTYDFLWTPFTPSHTCASCILIFQRLYIYIERAWLTDNHQKYTAFTCDSTIIRTMSLFFSFCEGSFSGKFFITHFCYRVGLRRIGSELWFDSSGSVTAYYGRLL